jgi:hypothetical protein
MDKRGHEWTPEDTKKLKIPVDRVWEIRTPKREIRVGGETPLKPAGETPGATRIGRSGEGYGMEIWMR